MCTGVCVLCVMSPQPSKLVDTIWEKTRISASETTVELPHHQIVHNTLSRSIDATEQVVIYLSTYVHANTSNIYERYRRY